MITVTERAAKKAAVLAEREGKPPVLRVGVRGGGCSGFSYVIEFGERREQDHTVEVGGLTVVCDPKSWSLLDGTELDYESNLMSGRFRFNNPNAKRGCGCGESFSA